ncbi:MAG: hypothetical protein JWO41_677 [Candidatus Saccharibacteria bacterium]|nr:hypothetical protein [Candidatus Saccharibacteria bacterium]
MADRERTSGFDYTVGELLGHETEQAGPTIGQHCIALSASALGLFESVVGFDRFIFGNTLVGAAAMLGGVVMTGAGVAIERHYAS